MSNERNPESPYLGHAAQRGGVCITRHLHDEGARMTAFLRGWALIVILVAGFLVSAHPAYPWQAPPNTPVDKDALQAKLEELSAWIEDNTDREINRLPAVLFVSQKEIAYMAYFPNQAHENTGVIAVYTHEVMILSENFKLGRDDYVLVHELMHHAQFLAGEEYPCPQAAEPEAYEAQMEFVEQTGRGRVPTSLFIAMLRCREH